MQVDPECDQIPLFPKCSTCFRHPRKRLILGLGRRWCPLLCGVGLWSEISVCRVESVAMQVDPECDQIPLFPKCSTCFRHPRKRLILGLGRRWCPLLCQSLVCGVKSVCVVWSQRMLAKTWISAEVGSIEPLVYDMTLSCRLLLISAGLA